MNKMIMKILFLLLCVLISATINAKTIHNIENPSYVGINDGTMKIVKVKTDYNFYGRLVPLICEEGGIVEDTQFTDNVEVIFRIPQDKVPFFESRLVDVSCGKFHSEVIDEKFCEI